MGTCQGGSPVAIAAGIGLGHASPIPSITPNNLGFVIQDVQAHTAKQSLANMLIINTRLLHNNIPT